jgi:pimeloyl-ACP methyl ester carboxylesterase
VVDHIRARRGVSKINLLGWSWGTVLTGAFTAASNAKIERLVLYAPVFIRTTPSQIVLDGPLGAYRSVTKEAAAKRRRAGLTDAQAAAVMPQEWFDAW